MRRHFLTIFLIGVLGICNAQERRFSYTINKDENSVPEFEVPDPLTLNNGKAVKNVRTWEKKRRPELLAMFENEMYGTVPGRPAGLRFEATVLDSAAFDGLAVRKSVKIIIGDSTSFTALVHCPKAAERPSPVFAGVNFYGNDSTLVGTKAYQWPYETILKAGFGVATVWRDEIELDKWNKRGRGIRDAFSDEYSWGAVAAWAWALSRVMDYIETDPDLDETMVIAIGHSRLGKAALWAAAADPRFAMAVSNNSGCAGVAMSKRVFGENLDAIQQKFPHWFCSNLLKYSCNEQALPFDQHELIALIAPRPVYVASADEDLWADPKGEWMSAYLAGCVYELYGVRGLVGDGTMPPVGKPQVDGNIGYHIRSGRHAILPYDWEQYIDFAKIRLNNGKKAYNY